MLSFLKFSPLLAGLLFLLAACHPDSAPVQPAPHFQLTASKMYYTDGSYSLQKYTYSGAGQLLRDEQTRSDGTPMSSREFQYTNGKVSLMKLNSPTATVAEYRYVYEGDRLIQMEYLEYGQNPTPTLIFDRRLEYDGQQPMKITTRYHTNAPSYVDRFTYSNGNVTAIKSYSLQTNQLISETTLEYDNRPNPFHQLVAIDEGNARHSSLNNVLRLKTLRPGATEPEQFVMEYEYNADGYPVKQITRFPDGKKLHEQEFTYTRVP